MAVITVNFNLGELPAASVCEKLLLNAIDIHKAALVDDVSAQLPHQDGLVSDNYRGLYDVIAETFSDRLHQYVARQRLQAKP